MLTIPIPGDETLYVRHLLLDYNGTLALDGELLPGVVERLHRLAESVDIHVLTADTHGTVVTKLAGLPCRVQIIASDRQDQRKLDYLLEIEPEMTIAVGNGRNDALMLRRARLGICLVQGEGASVIAMREADILSVDIIDILDMISNPSRLVATLRN